MDYEGGADYEETVNIMDMSLSRAPEPVTSNGEVCFTSIHLLHVAKLTIANPRSTHNASPPFPVR